MRTTLIRWAEEGLLPDVALRQGIRHLLRRRLEILETGGGEAQHRALGQLLTAMNEGPVAPVPEKANEQHYEVPAEFFELALGKNLKYSSALFEPGTEDLDSAEAAMLELSCQRAGIEDGMRVLELGCGWGSLTLWMARHYPGCRILAVSNSASQREHIAARAREEGLSNLRLVTADMNDFDASSLEDTEGFHRVVSVEMFEHMRNWRQLMKRGSSWLEPEGKLFIHIFCHRLLPYFFETEGAGNWMGRYFFTGGLMPSEALPLYFQEDLVLESQWRVSGEHYARTSRSWLDNLDARRGEALPVLADLYGSGEAKRWLGRWRLFFMACEELFGYRGGNEWWVGHYLFSNRLGR